MPDGGEIRVTTNITTADAHTTSRFSSVRPGPFVMVRVEDTGIGIPPAVQNRIFEPFFTTKENGTGLGLSVVYGVVQNHGGFINMESAPGRGTAFELYLPRALGTVRAQARARRRPLPRGTERILIIDDEVSVREIARDMLSGLGYGVDVAADGKEGVAFYRDRQAEIDLIILDVNMPVMGGKEAFVLLRSANPDVRILIVTGYGKESIEASRLANNVNGFIQKPFQIETLALKVRQILDDTPALKGG
jgi:CheY-like chemotaxis protein